MAILASYVSANSFVVSGNHELDFPKGRRLLLIDAQANQAQVSTLSAAYDSDDDLTTVTIKSNEVATGLQQIRLGPSFADPDNSKGNLCEHLHTDSYDGGFMEASRFSTERVDLLLQIPAPLNTEAAYFLRVAPDPADGFELFNLFGTGDQIPAMNTAGTDLVPKTVQGTTNQVVVTHAFGSITFSLPQDIDVEAEPTFATVTLSDLGGILIGNDASAVTALAAAGNNQILTSNNDNTGYVFVDDIPEAQVTFDSATGHAHTGTDSTQIDHGDLDNIGTTSHADIDAHIGDSDPHSGHEKTANKGAASGYAGLNASGYVPQDQLGSGTGSNAKVLYGDNAWRTISLDANTDIAGALVMAHITTPANPASGKVKIYVKSDNKLYRLDSAGNETEIG